MAFVDAAGEAAADAGRVTDQGDRADRGAAGHVP